MKISILFIAIIIILIIFTVRGYKKGIVGILFGVVSIVFLIAFVLMTDTFFENLVTENTGIRDSIYDRFLLSEDEGLVGDVARAAAEALTDTAMRIIGGIVALVVALLIVMIFRIIFKETLNDNSFIGGLSRFTGTIWGFIEGLIISWIILTVCAAVINNNPASGLVEDISENMVLSYLFEHNPVERLFIPHNIL